MMITKGEIARTKELITITFKNNRIIMIIIVEDIAQCESAVVLE